MRLERVGRGHGIIPRYHDPVPSESGESGVATSYSIAYDMIAAMWTGQGDGGLARYSPVSSPQAKLSHDVTRACKEDQSASGDWIFDALPGCL